MTRSRYVQWRSPERQPSARLKEECEGYRVATDILIGVANLGCSGEIYDFVWQICQREADQFVSGKRADQ